MYMRKLAPGGLLMVHLSNRHLMLEKVIANTADKLLVDNKPVVALLREDDDHTATGKCELTWAVLRDRRRT